jgi:hypothetical protein
MNDLQQEEVLVFSRKARELKACTSCGHVRRVLVSSWKLPNGTFSEASWTKLCKACDLVSRAIHYEQVAREYRCRATEIHRRRRMKRAGTA